MKGVSSDFSAFGWPIENNGQNGIRIATLKDYLVFRVKSHVSRVSVFVVDAFTKLCSAHGSTPVRIDSFRFKKWAKTRNFGRKENVSDKEVA